MIEFLTMSERAAAYMAAKPQPPKSGMNTGRKLNEEMVRYIRAKARDDLTLPQIRKQLAELYGVEITVQAVKDVIERRTYGSVA